MLFFCLIATAQSLPIDFETNITTSDFTDFDGGTATVMSNPQSSGINTSSKVAQIVRDGGQVWAGSKIDLAANLDFTTMNSISMKVFTSAPVGTTVRVKLEGAGFAERDAQTSVSNQWEVLTWDFTGEPSNFNSVVFMFDFGNVGNGSAASTFLFDDVLFGPNTVGVEYPEVTGLSLYPNPTKDFWKIKSADQPITLIEIFDIQGKRVRSAQPNNNSASIDAENLPRGMYVSKIYTRSEMSTLKLLKE